MWLTALTSGGVTAVALGIVKALFDHFFGRKKLSADAARVIEESASSAVQRVDRDNERLRERMEKLEQRVEELLTSVRARDERIDELDQGVRSRDRRLDDMSDELVSFREYSIELRNALQDRDPSLHLPEPPARIARHFLPP